MDSIKWGDVLTTVIGAAIIAGGGSVWLFLTQRGRDFWNNLGMVRIAGLTQALPGRAAGIRETFVLGALALIVSVAALIAIFLKEKADPIPKGAVMASISSCPSGWRSYGPAIGRFIVGAGKSDLTWERVGVAGKKTGTLIKLSSHELSDTGGEENHLLAPEEVPTRNHGIKVESHSDFARTDKYPGVQYYEDTSGEQPQNLMPPFIALNFCEKL
jgi:hypothetical protein